MVHGMPACALFSCSSLHVSRDSVKCGVLRAAFFLPRVFLQPVFCSTTDIFLLWRLTTGFHQPCGFYSLVCQKGEMKKKLKAKQRQRNKVNEDL